jgi:hypothetical protein
MAEHGADYHHGDMDIQEHAQTFSGFVKLTKWGSLYTAAALLLLTLWFCTPTGFLGAVITAVVVVVLGTLVLSDKHKL